MGFLFKRTLDPPVFGGLQVQTAVNAIPIPICYGSPKVAPNLIDVEGFKATRQSSGSKGLLSGGKGSTTERYFATLILGLCEGPVGNIVFIYQDNGVYDIGHLPPDETLTLFKGTIGQTPWSYMVTNFPSAARPYPFTAYLGSPNCPLDSSATIPQFNFMIQGPFTATTPLNPIDLTAFGGPSRYFADADPAICIYDLLTNSRYGIGFPVDLLDVGFTTMNGFNPAIGDAQFQTYCQATGFGFSVVIAASEQCSSILQRWLDLLGVAPVWNGITLHFVPYWDQFEGGNAGWDAALGIPKKYYQPDTTALFSFDDNDFLPGTGQDEDPVTIERTDQIDVLNAVRVNYRDRNLRFNSNVAEAKDEASIESFGIRADTLSGQGEFSLANYAQLAAYIRLQRNISVRNQYTFRLPFIWAFLDPMDIVAISDINLGLINVPVRIISIEEDEKFELTIVAEEYPAGGLSPNIFNAIASSGSNALNTSAVPPSVYTPVIRQPPAAYLTKFNQTPIIQIGASGGVGGNLGPHWGGCDVYISADNVTYQLQSDARITGATRIGNLTVNVPDYGAANPDTTSTIVINFTESGATVQSATDSDASNGRSLIWVGQELIGFTNATLIAPFTYSFTRLWRGMLGTTHSAHTAGEACMRIDGGQAEVNLPAGYSGLTVYVKLPSFNEFNTMEQSLGTATAYSIVVV